MAWLVSCAAADLYTLAFVYTGFCHRRRNFSIHIPVRWCSSYSFDGYISRCRIHQTLPLFFKWVASPDQFNILWVL